jgi:acyl-coenzyme A thioesterase PaaI-like protein
MHACVMPPDRPEAKGATRAFQDQFGVENRCYVCGPENPEGLQIKSYWHGDEAVCIYQPRPAFMAGPRHVLNGGVIATLIDCHSACTAIAALYKAEGRPIGSDPIIWCVTASMQVDYLRPTPIAAPVTLRARVESTEGKRTTVACSLSSGGIETARGRVVAVRVPPSWRGADDKPR